MKWNPWHGCRKLSAGCQHCYVYRMDEKFGKDSGLVAKTHDFDLPLRRGRDGRFKIPSGQVVYTCFTSDFFLEEADEWRAHAWEMMKTRSDVCFFFITKRIDRFADCRPPDWEGGYDNVHICCTVENQDRADYRLPIYRAAPIKHKSIICEPLLESIDLSAYLGEWVDKVIVGGESGDDARICRYEWVLDIRRQCIQKHVPFHFKQTGTHFAKDGRIYCIERRNQEKQARKAAIDLP